MTADPVPLSGEVAALLGEPTPSWGQLRRKLLNSRLPLRAQEQVWVWLVGRARREDGEAMLACAGLALPMLGATAIRFTGRHSPERHEAEAVVLAAFVDKVTSVDLDRLGVWPRLRWAAYTAARAWARREDRIPIPVPGLSGGGEGDAQRQVMGQPKGHPELLVHQAVAEGVITAQTAELIAATRIEGRSLWEVAAEIGEPYPRLHQRRRRAERRLEIWLRDRLADLAADRTGGGDTQALDAAMRAHPGPSESKQPRAAASSGGTGTTEVLPLSAPVEVNRRCA
ncbi:MULTISPECIES: hypothetical protein [unclassified Nocardia]|uniref:hypothetical protein n=1 Tax=unclassified Nocardia TaxID=2637762 RepID=UPI00278C1FF6|nr:MULTISPECIES: hypothetical protein [unclassified Nocardia]